MWYEIGYIPLQILLFKPKYPATHPVQLVKPVAPFVE
jgi:hypothetical protein